MSNALPFLQGTCGSSMAPPGLLPSPERRTSGASALRSSARERRPWGLLSLSDHASLVAGPPGPWTLAARSLTSLIGLYSVAPWTASEASLTSAAATTRRTPSRPSTGRSLRRFMASDRGIRSGLLALLFLETPLVELSPAAWTGNVSDDWRRIAVSYAYATLH